MLYLNETTPRQADHTNSDYSRLLAQHPDVLTKLRDEIGLVVGLGDESRLPDRNTLKKMKYLNLVLKEGMGNSMASVVSLETRECHTNDYGKCFDFILQYRLTVASPSKLRYFQKVAALTVLNQSWSAKARLSRILLT